MSLFGRIGTQAMKYSFELSVTSLHMSIPLTCPMSMKWTRGPRTATNQPVPGVNGEYEWPPGKPMTIIATMYYKKNKFQEKKSKLTVKQQLGKELKSVGQVEIDLADFCGGAGESEQVRPLTLKLQKCSDRKAFIVCTLRSKWIKQLQPGDTDDTASQMSGASSVDARSESAMPQGDVGNINDLDGMEDAQDDEDADGEAAAHHQQDHAGTRRVRADSGSSMHSLQLMTPTSSVSMAEASPSANASGHQALPSATATPSARNFDSAQLDVLHAKVSELTQAVNAERSNAAAQSSKAAALTAQLAQLTEAHEALRSEKEEREAEADRDLLQLRAKIATMQADMDKAAAAQTQQAKKLEQQLQEQSDVNEQLRSRLGEAESRTQLAAASAADSGADSNGTAAAAAAAAAAASQAREGFERERASLEQQVRDLRASLEKAAASEAELASRVAAHESKAKAAAEESARELAARDADVERLEGALAAKEQERVAAVEATRAAEEQLGELRGNDKEARVELTNLQTSFVGELTRRERAEAQVEADAALVQELRTALKKQEMGAEADAKAARAAFAAEKERWNADLAELKARLQREQEQAVLLASTAAAPLGQGEGDESSGGDASASSLSDKDAQIASLQKQVEEYMVRVLAVEEDRARLEGESAALESALSKAKEDELVALEERYEESNRFKALIRDKESVADEAAKLARDREREGKDHKVRADKLEKELREKTLAVDAA